MLNGISIILHLIENGMSDKVQVKKCADLLQAIAEPNRIRIIECLWEGSKNVTELATLLDVKIVNVSHHLGVLRSAGLGPSGKERPFCRLFAAPRLLQYDQSPRQPTSTSVGASLSSHARESPFPRSLFTV
jgi:hypothetical protein